MKNNILNNSGIYIILNKINGKCYIGSAIKILRRWYSHKSQLSRGNHHSVVMQRAWKKYGEDNFEFSVLEFCDSKILIEREQYFLDLRRPEYNISPTAGNCTGIKWSKESNLKKSINHAMRGRYGPDNPSSIPIYQYTLDGDFVRVWHGANEIERELGFSSANVLKSVNKQTWTPYGFIWIREFLGDKIPARKRRNRSKTCKRIGMFDLNGNLIKEFESQKDAYLFFNKKSNSAINYSLKTGSTTYKYKWRYL